MIPELKLRSKDALMFPAEQQNVAAVADEWMRYLITVPTLTSSEDNHGQVKAHVSDARAEAVKSRMKQAQETLDREGLVLQT
jgi:hypothetical protein